MVMPSLAVRLAGLELRNPLSVASGTFGSGREYSAVWESSVESRCAPNQGAPALSALGAMTTKGVSLRPWPGNQGTRIVECASGMLNSIGLQNPGVEEFCANDLVWLSGQDVPVIVNVCGHSADEYVQVIERLERETAVSAYEVNISCPNVDCGGMAFGTQPAAAEAVTAACRAATKRPLFVKLSPNVTDIAEIARAAASGGADALSLINTVAGMAIDVRTRAPVLPRVVGGLSGAAVKPIALYAVHRVSQAVKLPLVGMGGVRCATDVLEFMLAGATVVAVGTHNFTDPLAVLRIRDGLTDWCASEGVARIDEIIGGLRI